MDTTILHPEFRTTPYWWEAVAPDESVREPLPASADVVIVGGGLTGLNCAIELGRGGAHAVVIDAEAMGFGASTRNGGGVSGGNSIGKGLSGAKGRSGGTADDLVAAMIGDGTESLTHIESIVAREGIDCHYARTGRFIGAFTPKHYTGMAAKSEQLNRLAEADAHMVPRERQREEIASDYYYGGMVINRTGKIHPALYHHGLMAAAQAPRRDAGQPRPRRRADARGRWLARRDVARRDRGTRGGDRHQRLHRQPDAGPEAAPGADRLAHHRHRAA